MIKRMTTALLLAAALQSTASAFEVTSTEISEGKHMTKTQEFTGFGCEGGNASPQLAWTNPPKNTKSFAVTAYDPDAPTGSGWWHWLTYNIPNSVTVLPSGAGEVGGAALPKGVQQGRNDYGQQGFGGACPPPGHGDHHYEFTVFALDVEKLEIPEGASAALIGYMLNGHKIESAKLTALYKREK